MIIAFHFLFSFPSLPFRTESVSSEDYLGLTETSSVVVNHLESWQTEEGDVVERWDRYEDKLKDKDKYKWLFSEEGDEVERRDKHKHKNTKAKTNTNTNTRKKANTIKKTKTKTSGCCPSGKLANKKRRWGGKANPPPSTFNFFVSVCPISRTWYWLCAGFSYHQAKDWKSLLWLGEPHSLGEINFQSKRVFQMQISGLMNNLKCGCIQADTGRRHRCCSGLWHNVWLWVQAKSIFWCHCGQGGQQVKNQNKMLVEN